MTFALPYGAFIAAAIALFFLFRARHSHPRLRWSGGSAAQVASVTTWEPGPAPAPQVAPAPEEAAPAVETESTKSTESTESSTESKDGEEG